MAKLTIWPKNIERLSVKVKVKVKKFPPKGLYNITREIIKYEKSISNVTNPEG